MWSTHTKRFLLPKVKRRVFWSDQATPRVFSSTVWFLDLAPVVNLLPEYTVFQPVLQ